MSLPVKLVTYSAFGFASDTNPGNVFDDLQSCGLWPFHQLIASITEIEIWTQTNPNTITGCDVTYNVNGQPMTLSHGQNIGTLSKVTVPDSVTLTGISVCEDNSTSNPVLRNITFTLSDGTTYGPYPNETASNTVERHISCSQIIAFCGSTAANGYLDTIGVYTTD